MGRRSPSLKVEITEGAIRVTSHGRLLTLRPVAPPPDADETPDFIVQLDDIAVWDEPDGQEIAIEELQRILDAIETECDHHGLSVEFD